MAPDTHDNADSVKLREAIAQAIREAIMNEPSLLHPLDTFDANAIIRLVLPLVAEAEQRGYERGRVNAPRVVYENGYRAALEEARAKIRAAEFPEALRGAMGSSCWDEGIASALAMLDT